MKIKAFFFGLFFVVASLIAGADPDSLTSAEIIQGLRAHSQADTVVELKLRQQWLNNMWLRRTLLTNEAERIQLTTELMQILNAEDSIPEDKVAATALIGLFGLPAAIPALINDFLLWSKAAREPDLIPIEGEWSAQTALIRIGEPSLPAVIELIEAGTNAFELSSGAKVVLFIEGQAEGAELLKQASDNQTDSDKKANLQAALSSEYFVDPKYSLSGPEDTVKDRLQQEVLEARVTLKPEALRVAPGVLTATVRLPAGYPARYITSATCDGAFYERMRPNWLGTKMVIQFRRKDIEAALALIGESLDTTFVVRGVWKGATTNIFEGTDSIERIVGVEDEDKDKGKWK